MSSIIGGTIPVGMLSDNIITNIGTTDHLIQGQMITVTHVFSPFMLTELDDDEVKKILIGQLIDEIYKSRCVEFTKQNDPLTHSIVARARIYVTPDSTVKLLRTYQK